MTEQCPGNSRCIESACIANSPPTAAFTIGGTREANAEIALDGSSSSDPDEGDSISSYAWTVTKKSGDCNPPTIAGKTQKVTLRFACAGEFEIALIVTDQMHLTSEASTQTLTVAARTTPALVTVGEDESVGHRCEGNPLECTLDRVVQLSAELPDPAYQTVRWSVVPPPGREDGAGWTVRFADGETENTQDPHVEIVTTGSTPIAGDWQLVIEVLDGDEVLDSAVTRVSVGNQPPTIAAPARFKTVGHSYVNGMPHAEGQITVEITDPEGDPIDPTTLKLEAKQTGAGAATFAARWLPFPPGSLPNAVGFSVDTLTPTELIGPGVMRTVVVEAVDVNGGVSSSTIEVEVGNRPPGVISPMAARRLNHGYQAAGAIYYAEPEFPRWGDPDGDPLTYSATNTTPYTTCQKVTAPDTLKFRCATARLPDLLVSQQYSVTASDPWQEIPPLLFSFTIENAPPTFVPAPTPTGTTTCSRQSTTKTCTDGGGAYGGRMGNVCEAYTATIGTVSDADGDPLDLGNGTTCASRLTCTVQASVPEEHTCNAYGSPATVQYRVTDSASQISGSVVVQPDVIR